MNLIYPSKNINQFATDNLIESSVNNLVKNDNAFLILEKDEMTYIQILNTTEGIVVQFQEGSISSHFEFNTLMSRPQAIRLLKSYAAVSDNWHMALPYHKINVKSFWGSLGYQLGHAFGLVIKFFKVKRFKKDME